MNIIEKNLHKKKTIQQRLTESTSILQKYPDRVCIYLEKREKCISLPDVEKNKYLVPNSITIAQFMYLIRKRIRISSEQAIFIFVNNSLISCNDTMYDVYNKHKNNDGFLYITYSGENCFG